MYVIPDTLQVLSLVFHWYYTYVLETWKSNDFWICFSYENWKVVYVLLLSFDLSVAQLRKSRSYKSWARHSKLSPQLRKSLTAKVVSSTIKIREKLPTMAAHSGPKILKNCQKSIHLHLFYNFSLDLSNFNQWWSDAHFVSIFVFFCALSVSFSEFFDIISGLFLKFKRLIAGCYWPPQGL